MLKIWIKKLEIAPLQQNYDFVIDIIGSNIFAPISFMYGSINFLTGYTALWNYLI